MWSQRDLSLVGRINIFKTALSKLVFICSVMNTPKDFSKEVNKITFDFIWNDKPDKATREIKLTVFQYKIIHRILPTDSLLQKLKKVASPSCPFCPSESQTLRHLFINCVHASSFWNRFQEWHSISSNTKLLLSELEVMFESYLLSHLLFSPQPSHFGEIFLIC